jgi:RimJ/RimL family protein N-acetyltransferase
MKTITVFKNLFSFETEHLLAKKINKDDLDKFIALHTDPQVAITLTGALTPEKIREDLDKYINHWETHGFGLWVFYLKDTNEWIGRGGLAQRSFDNQEGIGIAYALRPKFWKQGLATEMAQALVEIAFESLHLTEVIGLVLPNNLASQRVLQKVGFQYVRKFVYSEMPCLLYQLTRIN